MNHIKSPVTLYFILGCCILLNACSSVISPKKTTGLAQLAVWKLQSEREAKKPSASKEKYTGAHDQVNGFLSSLSPEIKSLAEQPTGTVDLTAARLSPEPTASVTTFLNSSAGPSPASVTGTTDVVKAILDWAYAKAKENRKASADALLKKLDELKWKEWNDVHN